VLCVTSSSESRSDVTQLGAELTELALAGGGWELMLSHVARVTGRSVRLIGVHGACLVAAPSPGAGVDAVVVAGATQEQGPVALTCLDGWRGHAIALTAGRRRIGLLAVSGDRSAEVDAVLAAARVPVCIEAARRDAAAAERSESASWLIDEIRFGSLLKAHDLARVAARFALRLDLPHVAAAFDYSGTNAQTWRTGLSWIEFPVRIVGTTGWTILPDSAQEIDRIRSRLQGMVGNDRPILVACGSVVSDVAELPRSFREAEAALAVRRRSPSLEVMRFSDLGLLGLLLSVPRARLEDFVHASLKPILNRPDLLETLEAWIQLGGRRSAVAERLLIHRNSVGYRMGRVRELLGIDPSEMAASVQLHAAFLARDAVAVIEELQQQAGGSPVNPRT
jgi:hypothetical protein